MALVLLVVLAASFGSVSVGDESTHRDPCEAEALVAYEQALKLCELAESPDPNPRLRCYQAALQVYRDTLQNCRSEGK